MKQFRVATYNVHKCRGMDWRVSVSRTAHVISEIDAEIVTVQEIFASQAAALGELLKKPHVFGAAKSLSNEKYGNAVFTNFPITGFEEYNLTVNVREPRQCLRVQMNTNLDVPLNFFAVHLGTSFFERRQQAKKLLSREVLDRQDVKGSRMIAGDFNEWTKGQTTKLLSEHLKSADVAVHLNRSSTYPGLLPFLHLDHIYYDPIFSLVGMRLHKTRRSVLASDHLPLVADFTRNPDCRS